MLLKKKKQHKNIDYYLFEILIELINLIEPLILKEKKDTKKDLFTIFDELLQDLPRQVDCNTQSIKLQDKFAFQRQVYAFFRALPLKFPFPYKERKDNGIDMVFIYNNELYVIQTRTCMCNIKTISSNNIRELIGVQHIKADKYIFITNVDFSNESKEEAHFANVYLISGSQFRMLIKNKTLLEIKIKKESM